jgi:uncharacterized protein with PhoU and TrkA domain
MRPQHQTVLLITIHINTSFYNERVVPKMKYRGKKKKEFAEIEYKPRNVKELLVEMKDTSEFILDLAFSAVIFDSKEMADEVEEKEYEMDRLLYQIRMGTLIAAQTIEDAKLLSGILQVANAAEKISNAAGDIAELVAAPVEIRPVLPFFLCRGDEHMVRMMVAEKSTMRRRSIGELAVEVETGSRIIAVRRSRKWFYDPDANFKFRKDDVMVVRGVEEGLEELEAYATGRLPWGEGGPQRGLEKVDGSGCGPVGGTQKLDQGEKKFLKMKDISELMVDLAYGALLYDSNALAREVYTLEDIVDKLNERIQRHALTTIGPKNPDRAMALMRLAESMESVGDSAREIADVVLRDIEPHPVLKASIVESDNSITMARLTKGSILVGKSLRQVRLGTEIGMWVRVMRRGRRWIFDPDTSEKLKSGDRLIAVGPRQGALLLEELAAGKRKAI